MFLLYPSFYLLSIHLQKNLALPAVTNRVYRGNDAIKKRNGKGLFYRFAYHTNVLLQSVQVCHRILRCAARAHLKMQMRTIAATRVADLGN